MATVCLPISFNLIDDELFAEQIKIDPKKKKCFHVNRYNVVDIVETMKFLSICFNQENETSSRSYIVYSDDSTHVSHPIRLICHSAFIFGDIS